MGIKFPPPRDGKGVKWPGGGGGMSKLRFDRYITHFKKMVRVWKKIWPTNRFSMAKSYDFLFHKSDVTWRLSVNGLLLLLNRLKKSQRGVIRGLIIFMSWLNFIIGLNFTFFCLKLINIHYHTQIQRKIKFKPRTKSYHNLYYCDWSTIAIDLQLMHSDFLWTSSRETSGLLGKQN